MKPYKIVERIKKEYNLIEIILILNPIIDIITAFTKMQTNLNISIGIIARGLFLAFMILYLCIKSKSRYKKASIIYIIIVALYTILFIANTWLNKGKNFITYELGELIKSFYFPICLITIFNYIETKECDIKSKVLFCVAIEYITLVFIPFIINIGYASYAGERVGSIGFFFSANEISSIYAILFPIIVFSYKKMKSKIIYSGVLVYCLYTIMQLGTKLPVFSALVSIITFTCVEVIQNMKKDKKVRFKFITAGIILAIVCTCMVVSSPIYKNLEIYKRYLISTREDAILVESEGIDKENNIDEDSANNKENKLTGNEIATIIHSGRVDKKNKVQILFNNAKAIDRLLGLGKVNSDNTYNLSEIDYCDLLYNFGYIGFIIYFIPIITIVFIIMKKIYLVKIKNIINNDNICSYLISIFISFLFCAIAGHTFVAPAVSIFVTIMLIQTNNEIKKYMERNN